MTMFFYGFYGVKRCWLMKIRWYGNDRNSLTSFFWNEIALTVQQSCYFLNFCWLCDQQCHSRFTWGQMQQCAKAAFMTFLRLLLVFIALLTGAGGFQVSLGVLRVPTTIKEVGVWLSRFPIPTTKWRTIWNSVGWRFCEKTVWFVLICEKKLIGRWAFTEELLFWCRDPVGRLEGVTFEEIEQIWNKLVMKSYIWSTQSEGDFKKISIRSLPSIFFWVCILGRWVALSSQLCRFAKGYCDTMTLSHHWSKLANHRVGGGILLLGVHEDMLREGSRLTWWHRTWFPSHQISHQKGAEKS